MRKFGAIIAMLGVFLLAFAPAAHATGDNNPHPKVWVCKYVGQPGDYETLKDGKQPIQVDDHSASLVVGDDFADGQNHSVVIDLVTPENTDEHNDYTGGAQCPTTPGSTTTSAPTTTVEPPTTTTEAPTSTTSTTRPCPTTTTGVVVTTTTQPEETTTSVVEPTTTLPPVPSTTTPPSVFTTSTTSQTHPPSSTSPPTTTSVSPPFAQRPLPFTGSDPGWLVVLAVLLAVSGLVLVVWGGRKHGRL